MKNFPLKLFSLFSALVMWYFVANDVMIATVSIPVEIENPPLDKIILSTFSQQVRVKVSGPAFMVSGIISSPPVFKIAVPHDVESRHVVSLRGDEFSFPSAVQVIAVEPSEIEIRFDERISKNVLVEVPVLGPTDDDWRIDAIRPSPPRIVVSGPRTELALINRVETSPIDLREIRGSKRVNVSVRKPGVLSEASLSEVSVVVDVSLIENAKRFSTLPISVRGAPFPEGFRLDPSVVSVEVVGRKSLVRSIDKSQVLPYISLSSDQKGVEGGIHSLSVDLPKGLRVSSLEPSREVFLKRLSDEKSSRAASLPLVTPLAGTPRGAKPQKKVR
jgi:YbbR domain-containing protein